MLDGIERHAERKVGEIGMDAALLIDGHLVFLKLEVGDALLEDADEGIVGKLALIGEAGGGDGVEAGEEGLVYLFAVGDGGEGVVGEFIVEAVVAVGGGAVGIVAEVGFVLLVEEGVLGDEAVWERLGVDGGGRKRREK